METTNSANPPNPPVIALVGGGSGGHVTPLASLYRTLSPLHPEWRWHWIGERDSLESKIARVHGIRFDSVTTGKLRRYFSLRTFLDPWKNIAGFFQAIFIFRQHGTSLVFSKWGHVSPAVALAAWCMGIPVMLHESDTVPGLANRIVARFSRMVFLGFEEARRFFPSSSTAVVGQLLSPTYLDAPREQKHYDSSRLPRLLVQCGSQGSSRVFDRLLSIPELASRFETTVLLGTKNEHYRDAFEAAGVRAIEFAPPEELVELYQWADIAVTRGSATVLAEFALFGVRMCIVPLPETGGDHQTANARIYEQLGHVRMPQADFLDPEQDLLSVLDTLVYRSVHEDIRSRSAYDVIDSAMVGLFPA